MFLLRARNLNESIRFVLSNIMRSILDDIALKLTAVNLKSLLQRLSDELIRQRIIDNSFESSFIYFVRMFDYDSESRR